MPNRTAKDLAFLKQEKATNRVLGSGTKFPFVFSSKGDVRSIEISYGLAKVNQAIHMILSTRRGERILRPTYGCFSGDTEILLCSGATKQIKDLVGKRVGTFGTEIRDPTKTTPGKVSLVSTLIKHGAVYMGIQPTINIHLSNGKTITCTHNHRFLLSDYKTYVEARNLEPGTKLGWVDISEQNFRSRLFAVLQGRGSRLCDLPATFSDLYVSGVSDGFNVPVYDLVNSPTSNYTLAAGPIVHNSDLHKLVFEPNDEILWDRLELETATALRLWEPRIRVVSVSPVPINSLTITSLYGGETVDLNYLNELKNDNVIGILIEYIVLKLHQSGSYIYPFVREAAPFNLNT